MNPPLIPMFATANDTAQWAVAVDGLFGLFADRPTAVQVYESICPKGQHFDDSPFGASQLLPPGYRPINGLAKPGESREMTMASLSQCRAIDIVGYISKRPARRCRLALPAQSLAQRLAWRRFGRELFGG